MTQAPSRRLRTRYFIAGAVLALLWVGHGNEPAWVHAMRLALVLVTVRPLVILSRRYYARHWRSQSSQTRAIAVLIAIRLVALAAALLVGTLIERLATHHTDSVRWLTVLRLLLLLASIPLQVRLMRSRAASRAMAMERARWNWILAAKAALVAAALGVQVLLDSVLGTRADLVVAAGLLATVALVGPRVHGRLFGARRGQHAPVAGDADGPPGPDLPAADQAAPASAQT